MPSRRTYSSFYSEAILGELEVFPGFIIGGYIPQNVQYANDAVSIEGIERKL